MSADAPRDQPEREHAAPRYEIEGIRFGLRGRITLAVALVGLFLSVVLSFTTLPVAQDTLLDKREEGLTARIAANSATIRGNVTNADPSELQTLLSSLPDGGIPSPAS